MNQPNQNESIFTNNEIISLANQSCLIGINNLMKNYFGIQNPDQRKSEQKKNKIQISYIDLKAKDNNGKHPKHDFFIDPEEMKYFVETVYYSLMNPQVPTNVRTHGHKFMGGHKKPRIISNIITFNFLTKEEYVNSPNNKKIHDKFNSDKQRYNNAMLDWKNTQIAKLQFDKQEGKDMNGLIVPTGKRIEGANFKPYYLTTKDLLELCVTVRDSIQRTEMLFEMENKLKAMETSFNNTLKNIYISLDKKISALGSVGNVNQQPQPQQQVQQNPVPNVNQTGMNYNANTQPTNSQNPVQQPTNQQNNVDKEQKLKNEALFLIDKANPIFVSSARNMNMQTFLDCLQVDAVTFLNNTLHIKLQFESSIYNMNDLQTEKDFFNTYYKRCLEKVIKDNSKSYQVNINTL